MDLFISPSGFSGWIISTEKRSESKPITPAAARERLRDPREVRCEHGKADLILAFIKAACGG